MQKLAGKAPCADLAMNSEQLRGNGFQQHILEFVEQLATYLKIAKAKRKARLKTAAKDSRSRERKPERANSKIADTHAID